MPMNPPMKIICPHFLQSIRPIFITLNLNLITNDDPDTIQAKIKSSLPNFQLRFDDFDGIIQFWAPITTATGGRRFLTTSDLPFALNHLANGFHKHRLCSLKYQYNVDVDNHETEEDPRIINGAPTTAFLNHFPELLPDLSAHQGSPVLRSALECGLTACIVVPICDPSRRSCVGVLECFFNDQIEPIFFPSRLITRLEEVGLSTFKIQERVRYDIIHGLERARDEIKEALGVICETLYLGLAQVWIPYENKHHVAHSSSMEYSALKLVDHKCDFVDEDFVLSYCTYRDACDMLPLKMGEGVVGKTLENHEPHFCSKLDLLDTELSCFTVCLRSIYTPDFDYVFEFLWPERENYVILLESLLFALKRCLPDFKLVSGAQLGDELCVVDVDKSLENEDKIFKIFEGIRSSPIPKALEEESQETRPMIEGCIMPTKARSKTTPISLPREMIEEQYGKTMKEAAREFNVSLSTLKRKCNSFGIYEWRGQQKFVKKKVNEEDNNAIQEPSIVNKETDSDENTLTIKAEYGDDVIKFYIPISLATLATIEEEVDKSFQLNHGTYKLKYYDEDKELILLLVINT